MNKIEKLKQMINESNNIVAFTGAGISTDSGLKDFRSSDGLYNIKLDYGAFPDRPYDSPCEYGNPDKIISILNKRR